ncbi:MAG: T9SS type A sorting domain-containing protein, partial [Flavobacteriales bacterium]
FDEGPTITVAPVENTSYELLVTNEFNCQDTDAVVVEVIQYPEANVSVNGNDLLSGPASSYQWFLNGEIIEGAQNQDYLVSEDGNYQVQVSNEWGCSSMSEEQFVLFVSVYELSRWGDFKLYPNPASDQVVIESNFQSGLIEVFESNGRKIISEPFNDPISYINVSQLAEGVYQVQLIDKDGYSVSRRMVVFH